MWDVDQRIGILEQSDVFAALPPDARGVLAEMLRVDRFPAGSVVFAIDEPADGVLVLAEGRLSIFLRGQDRPVRTLDPGAVLGEYGMFTAARTATVRAEVDATVLAVDYERFREFLRSFPDAMLVLFESAVRRLVEAERRASP